MSAISINPANGEARTGEFRPLLVGVRDACRMLGIGKSKLYELADAGELNKVRFGGRALVTMASIDAFVARLVKEAA